MLMLALTMLAAAPNQCEKVKLSAEGGTVDFIAQFANNSDGFRKTSANFAIAYGKACTEGLLRKPLVSVQDKRLYLSNAPSANIASIHASGRRMVLEYPFISDADKVQIPTTDELYEAIYCATRGATAKEQGESGRCLPD